MSAERLASAIGITTDDMKGIMDQVKVNHRKLDACGGHNFEPVDNPRKLGTRYRCIYCGGEVSGSDARWYNLGFSHAIQASK